MQDGTQVDFDGKIVTFYTKAGDLPEFGRVVDNYMTATQSFIGAGEGFKSAVHEIPDVLYHVMYCGVMHVYKDSPK